MFKKLNILDEKDEHLRKVSVDAKLPLSKDYKKGISISYTFFEII